MMKPTWIFLTALVVLTCCLVHECRSANILIYMGMSSPSHKFAFLPYVQELLDRGHQVTFISPFPTEGAKFRDITPKLVKKAMEPFMKVNFIKMRLEGDIWTYWMSFRTLAVNICESVLSSPEVEDIVTGKEKFDLVIIDPLATECGFGFSFVNKVPVIYFHTAGYYPWTTAPLGLPSSAIFTPSYFTYNNSDIHLLTTRALTTIFNICYEYQRHWYVFPAVEEMWSQRLGQPVPSFADMERSLSLFLMNTHPIVEYPVPYMHNAIGVGGIHLQLHKPLPKNLEEFASGSGKDGFILFSLGSIVQAKTLPRSYYLIFLEVFRKLPQRIIWKWESEGEKEQVPANVLTQKWLPQYDLLAHPNCRGFVTHGGKLGIIEATQEGVPVVVIPFFADQDMHGRLSQEDGSGIFLDIGDVTIDTLHNAISSIATNVRYKKRAMQKSQIFRDQPDTPLARAMYWTEFVLRHPQGLSLRTEAKYFTWYQYHMVDVWVLVALIAIVPILVLRFILKCILRLVGLRPDISKRKKKVKSS